MPPLRTIAVVLLVAAGLAACDKAPSTPAASGNPAPPAAPFDPRTDPVEITVAHVLYAYKGASRSRIERTKDQARKLAQDAIKDLEGGRPFEEILAFTDDLQTNGMPNPPGGPPGTYSLSRSSGFATEFVEAGYATPVGKVAPKPVETVFGFHVMKRIK